MPYEYAAFYCPQENLIEKLTPLTLTKPLWVEVPSRLIEKFSRQHTMLFICYLKIA